MPRQRRMRRNRRYERKIEHRQWFTNSGHFEGNITFKNGADTDNVVKVMVDPLKGDDQTILRTRGYVVPSVNGANADIQMVLGAIVLPNKTAENASASDLPNPLVDSDSTDWFVWMPFLVTAELGGTNNVEEVTMASALNLEIDSKAKRIMEASDSVVWILGGNPEAAVSAKSLVVNYCIRTLVGY